MIRLDRLYSVRLAHVQQVLMAWLDRAQHLEPETLITTAAVIFIGLCQRFGVAPRQALEVAERVMRDAPNREPTEARALRLYLEGEL